MKLLLLLLLIPASLQAFPEMIRHNYVNCSACHVNNSGGGLLNAYGRTISYEVLSTWGTEKEARAFYSIDPEATSNWLNLGGDVRNIQLQQENDKFKVGRNIWMEANIQAAVTIKNLTSFLSFGQIKQSNQSFEQKITKYYFSYQFTDELALRAGRYIPVFGMNIPQHNYLIKKNLSFGPGSERDAIDLQYNGETYNFVLGLSNSLLDSSIRDKERALNIQIQKNILDRHKFGLNYWYGESPNYKKIVLGAQMVLGWAENLYSLAEVNHQWLEASLGSEEKSVNQLLKLGYELEKGLHLQLVQEWSSSSKDDISNYGMGLTWYPRPHFEIETLYSKKTSAAATSGTEDLAYFMTHFYF
ncbi:MAG: hypothetical protein ABL930_13895 [Pseudobdellovibrio sp.]